MRTAIAASPSLRDWPLWHFSRLEAALKRGDLQIAADAQRELERLGVVVVYRGLTSVFTSPNQTKGGGR
jgi:hypothetical protein